MSNNYHFFSSPQQIERDFNSLKGIIEGIGADNVINPDEINELLSWLLATKLYENKEPYKSLIALLVDSISQKQLDLESRSDIIWFCERYVKQNQYYDYITSSIQELHGILDGISSDSKVNLQEVVYLKQWLIDNSTLSNKYPYDEIFNLVEHVLTDNQLSDEEAHELLQFCLTFRTSRLGKETTNTEIVKLLNKDVFDSDIDIEIAGKSFCLTGKSQLYPRSEIEKQLTELNGIIQKGVTKKLDYLIICEEKNSCWVYELYGRKIEQAIKLKKEGAKLGLIHIDQIYPYLGSNFNKP